MANLKTNKIEKSLQKKGFVKDDGDHHFYIFFYNGQKTSIRTRISHGETDIAEPLISKMAKQVRLRKADFYDLVNCPLSVDEYIEKLIISDDLKTQ